MRHPRLTARSLLQCTESTRQTKNKFRLHVGYARQTDNSALGGPMKTKREPGTPPSDKPQPPSPDRSHRLESGACAFRHCSSSRAGSAGHTPRAPPTPTPCPLLGLRPGSASGLLTVPAPPVRCPASWTQALPPDATPSESRPAHLPPRPCLPCHATPTRLLGAGISFSLRLGLLFL